MNRIQLEKSTAAAYMERLAQFKILPNFWCSVEYLTKANWEVWRTKDDELVVMEEEAIMLPVLGKTGAIQLPGSWAGFPAPELTERHTLLDNQYFYNTERFLDLSGKRWKDTRKNLRWAQEDAKTAFIMTPLCPSASKIQELIEASPLYAMEEVYDSALLLAYAFHGENRWWIYGQNRQLYGLCAFDSNATCYNFRYCIVKSGIRGMSDVCRVLFYQTLHKMVGNVLVNDGGDLDRPELRRYKLRLNPVYVLKVADYTEYSGSPEMYKIKTEEIHG